MKNLYLPVEVPAPAVTVHDFQPYNFDAAASGLGTDPSVSITTAQAGSAIKLSADRPRFDRPGSDPQHPRFTWVPSGATSVIRPTALRNPLSGNSGELN